MSLYADEPDLMGPPSIYAVCSECSTQKPRGVLDPEAPRRNPGGGM